jgi:hypothetical protein
MHFQPRVDRINLGAERTQNLGENAKRWKEEMHDVKLE